VLKGHHRSQSRIERCFFHLWILRRWILLHYMFLVLRFSTSSEGKRNKHSNWRGDDGEGMQIPPYGETAGYLTASVPTSIVPHLPRSTYQNQQYMAVLWKYVHEGHNKRLNKRLYLLMYGMPFMYILGFLLWKYIHQGHKRLLCHLCIYWCFFGTSDVHVKRSFPSLSASKFDGLTQWSAF